MPYLQNATSFLIHAIFNFVLYIVLIRFWMQWVRADFRNEVGQFIINVTNPVVIPIRKIVPSIGHVDTATVLLALAVSIVSIVCEKLILGTLGHYSLLKLLTLSLATLLNASIYVFMIAIIVGIIASWVAPHSYHPVLTTARSIADPILAPARRLIPPLAGIDFSPMVVILFLQFSQILFVAKLANLAV